MAKAKKYDRRYVWFAINDTTGKIYGLYKPDYKVWELHAQYVTYQQCPRKPKMPASFKPDRSTDRRIELWDRFVTDGDCGYTRERANFDRTQQQVNRLSFANKSLRIICVRAGSDICPATLDWETVLRKNRPLHSGFISFKVKAS